MFGKIRNHILTKLLWAFMGLYLLNISIDNPDAHSNEISENLSINDQESIIELVLEKVLGFEDAIQEHDDPDSDEPNQKNTIKVDFIVPLIKDKNNHVFLLNLKANFPEYLAFLPSGYFGQVKPPPKV